MNTVRQTVQTLLDSQLMNNYDIPAYHLKRGSAEDTEGYIVYRIVSDNSKVWGDGVSLLSRVSVDINYYYPYSGAADIEKAENIIKIIKQTFLANGWYVRNGQSDLPNEFDGYKGINMEFAYTGVNNG